MNAALTSPKFLKLCSFFVVVVALNVGWRFLWPHIVAEVWPSLYSEPFSLADFLQASLPGLLVVIVASVLLAWLYGLLRKPATIPIVFFCVIAPMSVSAAFDLADNGHHRVATMVMNTK